jgi:hypothetical protein
LPLEALYAGIITSSLEYDYSEEILVTLATVPFGTRTRLVIGINRVIQNLCVFQDVSRLDKLFHCLEKYPILDDVRKGYVWIKICCLNGWRDSLRTLITNNGCRIFSDSLLYIVRAHIQAPTISFTDEIRLFLKTRCPKFWSSRAKGAFLELFDKKNKSPREAQVLEILLASSPCPERPASLPTNVLRTRVHFFGEEIASVFVLVILLHDGYLRFTEARAKYIRELGQLKLRPFEKGSVFRFFEILRRLPIEMQALICNIRYGSSRSFIPTRFFDPAARKIFLLLSGK